MEYITANGIEYECQTVTTGNNSIYFTMKGQAISSIEAAFKGVTELTVCGEPGGEAYGVYNHLSFESATVYEDGSIQVTMHIPDAMELRLAALEATQVEQDEAIAGLMFGGEE